MTRGAIVDKVVTLHNQLYSRAIKAACLGKTGEKRYPSINRMLLSTMIALVMKLPKISLPYYIIVQI